jgi:SagB-type dehydrogenase family enzyme
VLSRHACLRRAGDSLLLGSPLAAAAVELVSRDAIDLVVGLTGRSDATPRLAGDGLDDGWVIPVLSVLARFGLITDPEAADRAVDWGFGDLLFHASSGHARLTDPAERPSNRGRAPTLHPRTFGPAIALPPVSDVPGLPDAAVSGVDDSAGASLPAILSRRRSIRAFDDESPITLDRLGALLGHSARVVRIVRAGEGSAEYEFTVRPYPSAGALYPLELYAVIRLCDGIESGTYHYDPVTHALESVNDPVYRPEEALAVAAAGMGAVQEPQVLLVIAARQGRLSWKYGAGAYALVLRETGALMQTLYLVATWLGLAPCALGSGDGLLFRAVHDPAADPGEVSVGAFCVGSMLQPARAGPS